jgi:DNA-binding phage protein
MNPNWKLYLSQLDTIAKQNKISRAEIARRTKLHPSNIQRFFDCRFKPTLHTFLTVANALEVKCNLEKAEENGKLQN